MYEANKLKKRIFPVALSATGFLIFFYAFLMKLTVVFAYPLPEFDYALTVYALGKTYEFNYPEIDKNEYGYYIKGIDGIVDGVYSDTLVRAQNADFTANVNSDYPFTFSKESYGKCIDKEKLKSDITLALQNGKRIVNADTLTLKPEIALTALKSRMKLLSTFETNYNSSGAARKSNIALACNYIGYKTIRI